MKASNNVLLMIMHYEGFRSRPYVCPSGVVTIGYGTTVYPCGTKVKLTDARISEATAIEYAWHDINRFVRDVNSLLRVPVEQHQFDALVDFSYNVGSDIDADNIAEGLGDSTLLKLINRGIVGKAADWKEQIMHQIKSWDKGRKNGKKVSLPGLVKRRRTDALLFTTGTLQLF